MKETIHLFPEMKKKPLDAAQMYEFGKQGLKHKEIAERLELSPSRFSTKLANQYSAKLEYERGRSEFATNKAA